MNNLILDKLNDTKDKIKQNLKVIEDFLVSNVLTVPPECIVFSVTNEQPILHFHTYHATTEGGKDKLLAHIGHVCGRDGWQRGHQYNNRYDWFKHTEKGLRLYIHDAETLPPIETPVAPNKFPLLLEEFSQATE